MLCYCDYMWKEMKSCRVGGAESMRLPFDCPMDHVLDTPRWFEKNELLDKVGLREPSFLDNPRVPLNVSGSSVSVKLGKALTDVQVRAALAPHEGVAVVRIEEPIGTFCGFVDRAEHVRFEKASQRLLEYKRSPFCYEDGVAVPAYSQCCTPRKPGDAFFPCIHTATSIRRRNVTSPRGNDTTPLIRSRRCSSDSWSRIVDQNRLRGGSNTCFTRSSRMGISRGRFAARSFPAVTQPTPSRSCNRAWSFAAGPLSART
jgi:hypothetical protein